MKKTAIMFMLLLMSVILFGQVAMFPNGDGTNSNPYQISTIENLYWISITDSVWNASFIQTSDIDATLSFNWNNGEGWNPIGNSTTPFTGNYNGQGFQIISLTINKPTTDNIGMFGKTGKATGSPSGAVIRNLGLNSITVYGQNYVGSLIGYCNDNSTAQNCSSSGYITGNTNIGGLIGSTGLNSSVTCSYSIADIHGNNFIGGLIGQNSNSTIQNSYCLGNIIRNAGSLTVSIGGFVGNNDTGTIQYCYSTGHVSFEGETIQPINRGFAGANLGTCTYTANYFDNITSGQTASKQAVFSAAMSKSTEEMKHYLIFTTTGWAFIENNSLDTYWNIGNNHNNGYPYLKWQYPDDPIPIYDGIEPAGDGSSQNPYLIASIDNLRWMVQFSNRWSSSYAQTADIDAISTINWNDGGTSTDINEGWIPAGNAIVPFSGSYDGQKHIISNLYCYRPTTDNIGIFGYTYYAYVMDLGAKNVNFTGASSVGGLIGWNFHTPVQESFSTGIVKGIFRIGGLIGWNYSLNTNHPSTIVNCYSHSNVVRISDNYEAVGGFIGFNFNSDVHYCYSIGNVTYQGSTNPTNRGFLGAGSGGSVFISNYFDIETSEQNATTQSTNSAIGKLTSEMQSINTYTNWNFINIWTIQSTLNNGYPYFIWQTDIVPTLPVTLSLFNAVLNGSNTVSLQWITQSESNLSGYTIYRSNSNLVNQAVKISNLIPANNSSNETIYDYTDIEVIPNNTYFYWIVATELNGHSEWYGYSSVTVNENSTNPTPVFSELKNIYPNPFKPAFSNTTITCNVKENETANLSIYNIKGQKVKSFTAIKSGSHQLQWNGKDNNGNRCPSGTYFYHFSSPTISSVKKIILIK